MIRIRHYARPYRAKCDCCKRVTAVQDKAEVTRGDVLIGEITICMQCLPAFAGETMQSPAAPPPQPAEYRSPAPAAAQVDAVEEIEEIEEGPLIEELTDDAYDDLIGGADEVVGLFG